MVFSAGPYTQLCHTQTPLSPLSQSRGQSRTVDPDRLAVVRKELHEITTGDQIPLPVWKNPSMLFTSIVVVCVCLSHALLLCLLDFGSDRAQTTLMSVLNVTVQCAYSCDSCDLGAIAPNCTVRLLGKPRSPFCPDGDRYILGG